MCINSYRFSLSFTSFCFQQACLLHMSFMRRFLDTKTNHFGVRTCMSRWRILYLLANGRAAFHYKPSNPYRLGVSREMQLFPCVCFALGVVSQSSHLASIRFIWSVVLSTAQSYDRVYANKQKPFRYCSSGTDLHRTTVRPLLVVASENFLCLYVQRLNFIEPTQIELLGFVIARFIREINEFKTQLRDVQCLFLCHEYHLLGRLCMPLYSVSSQFTATHQRA